MKLDKVDISIIIVNYKTKKELIDCISSIVNSKPKVSFEIIVVDNDSKSDLKKVFRKIFQVKYVESVGNLGYGGGNNLGARYAQGRYLFILNPDTELLDGALDNLHKFFIGNDNAGIISPVFLDNNLRPFKSQGSRELTPKTIIFSQSILGKIFRKKNIYNEEVLSNWNMRFPITVDVVPGAAMMISAILFKKIGGFDEKIFLYFEENDISKRVSNLGYKMFIVPTAKIIHLVGRSTKNLKNLENIYSKSRYLYLRKHYGLLKAIFAQAILLINKTFIFVLLILVLAFFLRIFNLRNSMEFIGDQAWFYISARDILIKGQIPLVGIASSHPWLHQGPLWTYILAIALWIFKFNPVGGAYLTAFLGTITVFIMYFISSKIFSKRIGAIAACLYATSPLIITSDRFAYHTSLIPLFTLIYIYFLYEWISKENNLYFSLSILTLGILYNFELATIHLWFVLLVIIAYGLFKKKSWTTSIFKKNNLTRSVIFLTIPMFPVLIYDLSHGFVQTFGFFVWILYKLISSFISIKDFSNLTGGNEKILVFAYSNIQRLLFLKNGIVAIILFVSSIFYIFYSLSKLYVRNISSRYFLGYAITLLIFSTGIIGFFVNKNYSDAYLQVFFPLVMIMFALLLDKLSSRKFLYSGIIILFLYAATNIYILVSSNYSYNQGVNSVTFTDRIKAARSVVILTNGKEYNIVGKGWLSEFKNYVMNYEYLAWWLGHGPSKNEESLKIYISESENGIRVEKLIK